MEPAQSIISKCGGPEVVAAWTGAHVTRVRRWTYPKERGGTGGLVPSKWQGPLLAAAVANGIGLTPADFFDALAPAQAA